MFHSCTKWAPIDSHNVSPPWGSIVCRWQVTNKNAILCVCMSKPPSLSALENCIYAKWKQEEQQPQQSSKCTKGTTWKPQMMSSIAFELLAPFKADSPLLRSHAELAHTASSKLVIWLDSLNSKKGYIRDFFEGVTPDFLMTRWIRVILKNLGQLSHTWRGSTIGLCTWLLSKTLLQIAVSLFFKLVE